MSTPCFAIADFPNRGAGDAEHPANLCATHSDGDGENLVNLFPPQLRQVAPLKVDRTRDGLQVVGVDAEALTAQVVQIHSGGDWAARFFVVPAMRTVALGARLALPNVARRFVAAIFDGIRGRELVLVSRNVLSRMPAHRSGFGICKSGDLRRLAAPAHAQSTRVRRQHAVDFCDRSLLSVPRFDGAGTTSGRNRRDESAAIGTGPLGQPIAFPPNGLRTRTTTGVTPKHRRSAIETVKRDTFGVRHRLTSGLAARSIGAPWPGRSSAAGLLRAPILPDLRLG